MAKVKILSEEQKRLHKKLIPANIIIAIISLFATFSLLFMPFLDLRIKINTKKLAQIIEEENILSNESAGSEAATGGINLQRILVDTLYADSLEIPEISVNLYPIKMLSASSGNESDISKFIISSVGKNGVNKLVNDLLNSLIPPVLATTINTALDTTMKLAIERSGVSITPEQEQQLEEYKDSVSEIVYTLVGDGKTKPDPDKAKEEFKTLMSTVAEDQGVADITIDEAKFNYAFDDIVEAGTKDGEFSILNLLENIDRLSTLIETFGKENTPVAALPSYNNEDKPVILALAGEAPAPEDENSGELQGAAQQIQKILNIVKSEEAAEQALTELIAKGAVDISVIQYALLACFILFAAIPALVWLLLAISAVIHIFKDKKTVGMKTAKLFGFFSAFFIIAINPAVKAAPSLIGGSAARIMEAVSVSFLGSAAAVAVCWAALVLLSIFYYSPLKRKIKAAGAGDISSYGSGESEKRDEDQ